MLSLRSLARAAPRALPRNIARQLPYHQQQPLLGRALLRVPVAAAAAAAGPSFSTSATRAAKAVVVDSKNDATRDFSAKLDSEIRFEQEIGAAEQVPATVKDYLDNSPFKILDTPGKEEVKLVRNYKNEKITVSFSVTDMNSMDDMFDDEQSLDDDGFDDTDGVPADIVNRAGAVAPGAKAGKGRQPRAAAAGEQQDEDDDDDDELLEDLDDDDDDASAAPIHLHIVIEKPSGGRGALTFEATAQHGALVVDSLAYLPDVSMAHDASADASHARHGTYSGPPFGSLDEELQVLVEKFLEERGIAAPLASFLPEYIDMKEQKEYTSWLRNVKDFVDA